MMTTTTVLVKTLMRRVEMAARWVVLHCLSLPLPPLPPLPPPPPPPPPGLIVYFLNHCKQMPSVSLAAVICTLIT